MEIVLTSEKGIRLPRNLLIKVAKKVLRILDYNNDVELSVSVIGDNSIRKLNRKYRKKNYSPDVLSFPANENFIFNIQYRHIGDIVIGIEAAKTNAGLERHSLRHELICLIVHGILHLSGYNHEGTSKSEAERMMKKQERILREVFSIWKV